MTSSLSFHDKEQREQSNDVSIDRAMRKAKPTEGKVLVFACSHKSRSTCICTLHLTAYFTFCISTHQLHSSTMSATKRSGSPSPIVRIKTSIVTFAVREDGDENIINHTEVAHQDVAHLTGLQSDFLNEMVQRPSPGKRPAPSGPQGSQRRS